MTEYIERGAALSAIDRVFDQTDPTGAEQIGVLKSRGAVCSVPAADVVSVRPELRAAVEKLAAHYEKALGLRYATEPVAWALHRTLKAVEAENANEGEK